MTDGTHHSRRHPARYRPAVRIHDLPEHPCTTAVARWREAGLTRALGYADCAVVVLGRFLPAAGAPDR